MIYSTSDVLEHLRERGHTVSRPFYSSHIVPVLLETGRATRLGTGKRAPLVMEKKGLDDLVCYLTWRKEHQAGNMPHSAKVFNLAVGE